MLTHRTKVRRHLRSARVAALTPKERSEELRTAEARGAAGHGGAEQAGVDPAGATGRKPHDSVPGSPAI
jgi:hypothetical protein